MIGAMAVVAARRAGPRVWQGLALAIALAAPLLACRDPFAQIEQDKKRFPALSLTRPTPRPVFVALGRSAYGDGGLSQVHEVCWTSKGGTQGVIVYSSAYPAAGPALRARDVFRAEDLGARGAYYNSGLALRMLAEILQDRDLSAAEALLDQATALLDSLPAAVDGTSGAAIPSRVFRSREWADLLAFRLGLAVGRTSFEAVAGELEAVVKVRDSGPFCFDCERYARLLPLYRWVNTRMRTPGAALPEPSTLERGVGGYDPVGIVGLLGGEPERRHQTPTTRFWEGVRAYAAGDRSRAGADLAGWLALPPPATASGFELGAAARLLDGLQAGSDRD